MTTDLPQFVSVGEALTDLLRVEGEQWLSKPGGAGWNVARVMASLGIATGFAGAISKDWFGQILYTASRQAHLDLRFLQQFERPPLLAIVYETSPPQYSFIGENSADLAFDPAALPKGWQSAVKWVHFGSISLAREPLAQHLIAVATSLKQLGVHISYDPNFRHLMDQRYDATLKTMCQLADVIKVSDEDLYGLFRTDDHTGALKKLRGFNPEAAILLTLGAQGASILVSDQQWHVQPPDIEIVDTVGAGDASAAGLIYSLIKESEQKTSSTAINWEQHLRFSVACGSAACLNAGPLPPRLEQVQEIAGLMF